MLVAGQTDGYTNGRAAHGKDTEARKRRMGALKVAAYVGIPAYVGTTIADFAVNGSGAHLYTDIRAAGALAAGIVADISVRAKPYVAGGIKYAWDEVTNLFGRSRRKKSEEKSPEARIAEVRKIERPPKKWEFE